MDPVGHTPSELGGVVPTGDTPPADAVAAAAAVAPPVPDGNQEWANSVLENLSERLTEIFESVTPQDSLRERRGHAELRVRNVVAAIRRGNVSGPIWRDLQATVAASSDPIIIQTIERAQAVVFGLSTSPFVGQHYLSFLAEYAAFADRHPDISPPTRIVCRWRRTT